MSSSLSAFTFYPFSPLFLYPFLPLFLPSLRLSLLPFVLPFLLSFIYFFIYSYVCVAPAHFPCTLTCAFISYCIHIHPYISIFFVSLFSHLYQFYQCHYLFFRSVLISSSLPLFIYEYLFPLLYEYFGLSGFVKKITHFNILLSVTPK